MPWRLRVMHRTAFEYRETVHTSYNEVRISPLDTTSQFTLEHRVEVAPRATLFRYRDYWGTRVHAFDLHQPHRDLVVTGHSLVETAPSDVRPHPDMSWDDLRTDAVTDRFCEYLAPSPATAVVGDVAELARIFAALSRPAMAVDAIVAWLGDELRYTPGSTDVTTTAAEVLEHRQGVCQDFAHLGLALLRGVGIPARYASGYLFPDEGSELGSTHEGQSHAWLEAWVGEWCPSDPTSAATTVGGSDVPSGTAVERAAVGERHVVVAKGREYGDVAPLKGVVHGGGSTPAMHVSVELTRMA
ncbi:MAG: transglutaminase family protein [Acidimicrobiia bacterium]|jgi:transglutaminase-like putative cysteine protease